MYSTRVKKRKRNWGEEAINLSKKSKHVDHPCQNKVKKSG